MQEEERLVRVLRDNKEAIGWTIADIKALSLSICMHKISTYDGSGEERNFKAS